MMAIARRALCASILAALASAATPATLTPPGAEDALDLRLKKLETGLRCLVCQNQTLADSNAELAADLRREVRELALAGKSDDDIRTYLVARYGDFVLYDPPLRATTTLLWIGPFALLAVGGALWFIVLRRRARVQGAREGGDAAARALIDEEDLPT